MWFISESEEGGSIVTNCANTTDFKKASKKVIQFASHVACAYPDYCIQRICRHEFSGAFIGKSHKETCKEIWPRLDGEWIPKTCAVLLQLDSFFYVWSKDRGILWPLKVSAGAIGLFWIWFARLEATNPKYYFTNYSELWKNPKMKNGGKALLTCYKSVHPTLRWHCNLLKIRYMNSSDYYNSCYT